MRKFLTILFLLLSTTLFSQITNSGFEVDMAGWTVVSGSVTRSGQATIGTWNVLPAGSGMAKILPSGTGAATTVQSSLGLTGNQLSSVASIQNVGAMYQDIVLTAGQSFTIYWNYVSQDYAPYDDGTFLSFTGPSTQNLTMLARTQSAAQVPAVQSYGSTGWKSITITAGPAGTYRLGFGAFNWGDTGVDPILFVDNAMGGTAAPGNPIVTTTNAATNITSTTATTGGNVSSDGGNAISERGVVYATTTAPTISNSKVIVAGTTGTFTADLTGLVGNTTYYVRAYAKNGVGTTYGPEVSFKTLSGGIHLTGTISYPSGINPNVSLSLYKMVSGTPTLVSTQTANSNGGFDFTVNDLNNTYRLVPTMSVQGITSEDFDLCFNECKNINTPNNLVTGLIMTGTKQWIAADVNRNGKLDLGDAYLIAAHITTFRPITEVLWFVPSDYDSITKLNFSSVTPVTYFTINVVTSDVSQNIKYCILGDVNLSHSSQ